jgi:hypothetical protein
LAEAIRPDDGRPPRPFLRSVRFGVGFGVAIGLAAIPGAMWSRHAISPELAEALALLAVGAAAAGFLASQLGRLLPGHSQFGARLAAAIVLLVVLTTGCQVVLLFAEYAPYYAQWWPPPFTWLWWEGVLTTFAGVGFYYGAIGLPMLLPLGFPALLVAAFLLARR